MDKKRILLIDDETELVEMVKMRLEASGYELLTAYDGQVGLEKARQEYDAWIDKQILEED